jgi:hypothetical protein
MKRHLLLNFIFLFAVVFTQKSFSQYDRQVDSLTKLLSKTRVDTTRVKILNDLGGYRITKEHCVIFQGRTALQDQ